MTSNFPNLPKFHTGALGFAGSSGAGANWRTAGAGTRRWDTDNALDNLRVLNRAYLRGQLVNSGTYPKPSEGAGGQPLYKKNSSENGETPIQNPDDLNYPEAIEAFKDCIEGEASNDDDGEQTNVTALEEPLSAGCQNYHGTSFNSAISKAATRVFSKIKTPNPYNIGRQSGDDPMLGVFEGTAAFEDDNDLGIMSSERCITSMGEADTQRQWVAPKDIDFEKGRKAMEEWRKKRKEESESGWDTEWTGLLG